MFGFVCFGYLCFVFVVCGLVWLVLVLHVASACGVWYFGLLCCELVAWM